MYIWSIVLKTVNFFAVCKLQDLYLKLVYRSGVVNNLTCDVCIYCFLFLELH